MTFRGYMSARLHTLDSVLMGQNKDDKGHGGSRMAIKINPMPVRASKDSNIQQNAGKLN